MRLGVHARRAVVGRSHGYRKDEVLHDFPARLDRSIAANAIALRDAGKSLELGTHRPLRGIVLKERVLGAEQTHQRLFLRFTRRPFGRSQQTAVGRPFVMIVLYEIAPKSSARGFPR